MYDYEERMNELLANRFCCSQTVVALGLELKGIERTDAARELIKAVSGLCTGMGGTGNNCGALSGGACVIGLFCGRGETAESPHNKLHNMVRELVDWFEAEFGSVTCKTLMGGDPYKRADLCPKLVQQTFERAVQIMLENDVEIL